MYIGANVGRCDSPYAAGYDDKVCNQFCQSKYGSGSHSHRFCFNTKCQRDTSVCAVILAIINFHSQGETNYPVGQYSKKRKKEISYPIGQYSNQKKKNPIGLDFD